MTPDCLVCEGKAEPIILSVTGDWSHVFALRYGDAEFHVHGSQTFARLGVATTFWLAPGPDHGKTAS